jgi:hypothetical protein
MRTRADVSILLTLFTRFAAILSSIPRHWRPFDAQLFLYKWSYIQEPCAQFMQVCSSIMDAGAIKKCAAVFGNEICGKIAT